MTNVLEVKNLSKAYGGVLAVNGASLAARPGSVTSVFGSNGAGKTSLFNLIAGFVRPDSGAIIYKGQRIDHLKPAQRAALGIGRLWQDIRLFRNMSVMENLLVAKKSQPGENILTCLLRPRAVSRAEKENLARAEEVLDFVGLGNRRGSLAQDLSYGQQKLLALGRLLMNDADLLLLDELTSGVNPLMIDRTLSLVRELARRGKAVLMIEHNVPKAMSISDVTYVMHEGRVEESSIPTGTSPDELLKEVYLSV